MKSSGDHLKNDIFLSLKTNVKNSLVRKFIQGSDRPFNENDFLETKNNNVKLISGIKLMIESLFNDVFHNENSNETESYSYYPDFDNELLVLILVLCGQNSTLQFWNTSEIVEHCNLMLFYIQKLFKCRDTFELISRKVNLTKSILQTLSSDLTKSEWKNFPASVVCYKWILKMIKQPDLSQHLQFILPPALLLIDDFITENRIIGAQCLDHIIQNVTIAEVQLCGHGEIIYAALLPLLRVREANLIQFLLPPLVTLTSKLEFDLGKKNPSKVYVFFEIICALYYESGLGNIFLVSRYQMKMHLEIYLENMELEQITNLRNCYIKNLSSLIEATGCNVIRWTKKLLRILDEYIQTAGKHQDEETIQHCVKVIETYIQLSEKEKFLYKKHLIFTLLMVLQSTTNFDKMRNNTSQEIVICKLRELTESLPKAQKEKIKNDFQKNLSCCENFLKFYQLMNKILFN